MVEPVGEDRCRLTMISTSLDWPTQALDNVGADFEVLGSPEFAAHLHDWGTRFLRASGPGVPASPSIV